EARVSSLDDTDKLTRGHGLALHNRAWTDQKYVIGPHIGLEFPEILVCGFHIWSESKLTCHYHLTLCAIPPINI
ncbi:hypothetical protein, partial [Candidatus Marimicrobium litorale]|uniref:hypothetical protein n=1 Tax=Candidatus Marimicrobium litorale TaxID=2518991 RepID=UPI00242CB8C2